MFIKKLFIYLFTILNIYFMNNFLFSKEKNENIFCSSKNILFPPIEKLKNIDALSDDNLININSKEGFGSLGNYILIGDVILEKDKFILNSEYINLRKIDEEYVIDIPGTFLFQNLNRVLMAQNLSYNLNKKKGNASNFVFRIYDDNIHFQGQGSKIDILDKDNYRLYDTKANTCKVQDDSWYVRSKDIKVDKLKNVWIAKNAKLVLQGVPILFLPWMDFPLNGNRKSGFLFPIIGLSNSNGLELGFPYYLNLAPNYDATITPYLYYRRGLSFITEFRYLGNNYFGNINFHILPNDKLSSNQELLNYRKKRYISNFNNSISLSNNLKFLIDFNKASDNYFYRDLGSKQNLVENTYLNQQVSFNYNNNLYGGDLKLVLTAQKYQILQDANNNIAEIYNTIPQLTINYYKDFFKYFEFELFSQLSRFKHDYKPSANREVIYPSFKLNYSNEWFSFKPKVGVHATFYQVDGINNGKFQQKSYNRDRVLPIFSLESGLVFEREFKFFNKKYIQTLDPKFFYVYIPNKEQNNLSNFDSSENDFTYEQLFKENRFSGNDRINYANHISLALMSRIYNDSNGIERFRLGLGKSFYFNDDLVNLYNTENYKNKSDTIFFARGYINKKLYFFSDIHYDGNQNLTSKYTSGITYNPTIGKIISLRIKHDNNSPSIFNKGKKLSQQIDISGQWPISNRYYLLAKHNYSFSDNKTLENILGVEYKSKCGCWGISFVLQRYLTDYNNHRTSVFFRLILKGLGGIGSNPIDELQRSIPNYVPVSEVRYK